jgi:hypothetical protein
MDIAMDRQSSKPHISPSIDLLYSLAAAALGLLAVAVSFIIDPRFFYIDDKQAFFIPYMTDIAAQLRQGGLPFLSLSTVFGGNYSIDWQHGLLNPISLLSYLLVYSTHNMQLAGAYLAAMYATILSIGTYFLARSYSIAPKPAVLFSLVIATNNFLLYWAGSSWHNHLSGLTWFVWSWLFIQQCGKQTIYGPLGLLISTYLLLTSGFIQAAFAVCILMSVFLVQALREHNLMKLADILSGGGIALLLALPSLLPAFFTFSYSVRESSVSNNEFLTPSIGDYLLGGAAAYLSKIPSYSGSWHTPIFYLSWFFPPLLFLINPAVAYKLLIKLAPVLLLLIIFLLLGTGAENLGPIRYPFRFIPFAHIAAGIALFSLLFKSGPLEITTKRKHYAQSIIVLMTIVATLEKPSVSNSLVAGILTLIFLSLAITRHQQQGKNAFLHMLFLSTILIFFATHFWEPINPDIADWGGPSQRTSKSPPSIKNFHGYSLTLGPIVPHTTTPSGPELPIAATGILKGTYTFNGYTPFGHKALQQELCIGERTQTDCPEGVAKWTEPDPQTQTSLLDLFKITQITAQYGMWWDGIAPHLGTTWHSAKKGNEVEIFERNAPITLPGTLSWHPKNIQLAAAEPLRNQHESLTIKKNPDGGRLIFARLFWPGYKANFNGEPLNVIAHRGFLVAIDLPANTTGQLRIWFRPPGLLLGLGAATAGLMLFLLYLPTRSKILCRTHNLLKKFTGTT